MSDVARAFGQKERAAIALFIRDGHHRDRWLEVSEAQRDRYRKAAEAAESGLGHTYDERKR